MKLGSVVLWWVLFGVVQLVQSKYQSSGVGLGFAVL
jgi:hypothetical protein